MDSMSIAEIYDVLMAIREDPEAGRRSLQTNPSLAYALLQAQVILGFIPEDKAPQYFVGFDASSSSAMSVDAAPSAVVSQTVAPPAAASYAAPPSSQPPYGYSAPPPAAVQHQQPPPPQPLQQRQPGAPPPLAELVRMPPHVLAQFNLPEQYKTLVNIVHNWSSRSAAEFESLTPEQMLQIRRIFEEAHVPLPGSSSRR